MPASHGPLDPATRAAGLAALLLLAGTGTATVAGVAVSRPVAGSTRKTFTTSDPCAAASSQRPAGSRAKLRGVFPPIG